MKQHTHAQHNYKIYQPIPLNAGAVKDWKQVEIEELFEPLIPLGAYSATANSILTSSVYYGEHDCSPYIDQNALAGSLLTIFVRQKVAERLLVAQQLLPEDHYLLVFDAYRPLRVQESLYHFYYDHLRALHPNKSKANLSEETQQYVSIPTTDQTRPSPHSTGGAIDLALVRLPRAQSEILRHINSRLINDPLEAAVREGLETQKATLVRRYATMLNFGTPFDHGGEKAAIAYFEKQLAVDAPLHPGEVEACTNRRLLYEVMTQVGMQAYGPEWWHFNAPESQMGAKTAGLAKATYGAATLSTQNEAHEKLRRAVYSGASAAQAKSRQTMTTNRWPIEIIMPQNC